MLIGLAAVAVCLAMTMSAWWQYQSFLNTPLGMEQAGTVLDVTPGDNLRTVIAKLEKHGVTEFDWRWRLLSRIEAKTIRAGEYALPVDLLPADLLNLLASGKVVSYRFTIVEGWTVGQLLKAMALDPVILQTIDDPSDLAGQPGLPGGNPEGWFLPETYSFVRGDSDMQILRRAYADMQSALVATWQSRDMGLPLETPEELLILASIIEKETSVASEREEIAGVFIRRLQKRWRLETDPTVIYGMGENYKGDIRRRDLRTDTPYNTYTRHGLPPTPIALPGLASLQAAAHPAESEAMFFVADGHGGHTFSKTLEEHNRAVRDMIRRDKASSREQVESP